MTVKKQYTSSPDALIFDMDGTLWDAVETYTLAWNKYFEDHNISKKLHKKDLDALMGLEEQKFLEIVLPDVKAKERTKCYHEVIEVQYDLIDQRGGNIYDGVLQYIPLLSEEYPLFIVSNCPKYTIHHFMKFANIEPYIMDTVSHGQNYRPKNENIRLLRQRYNLQNPVYIGDTDSDRIQSEKAQVPFIFMTYGFGNSDHVNQSFDSFVDFALHFLDVKKNNK